MTLSRISLLAACLSLACSSSKPLGGAAGSSGAGGGVSAEQCTAPGYHVDAAAIEVSQVQAQLQDPSGAAVPNLPIQVCGTNTCTYGSSNAAGTVNVTPNTMLVLPAFKYGDGLDFAELAVPLSKSKQDLGTIIALPLPDYADGAAFTSGDVTNGDVTLHIDKSTDVEFDLLTYEDDSQHVLRSVSIPVAKSTEALPASFGFELAYAASPLGTTFCPPAPLSLKNTLNWDSGTAVEVFVQGVNADEAWAPYGSWVKVADGSVSTDGSSIDTTNGGITVLSSIAVRRKQ